MFYTYRKVLVIISLIFCLFSIVSAYSGGSGELNDPYLISTAEDMNQIGQNYTDWDKCFKLTADLDLEGIELKPIGNISGYESYFRGIFDGNGHTISNLKFDVNDSMIGLFGYISEGVVQNVNLEGVDIKAGSCVGAIAARGYGLIQNCHVSGIIKGQQTCGGITGFWAGVINNCSFEGRVSGTWSTGGIAGFTEDWAEITKCYAIADINGETGSGGIVGTNEGGNFEACFAKGTVTGTNYAGGFVGRTGDHCGLGGIIRNCYSTGTVSGGGNTGGLAGYNYGNIIASFWDVNTSGWTTSAGGIGKTTAEMQTLSTFTSAGWDFSYTDGDVADWFIQIDEYPILTWQISPADIYTDGRNNFRDFAVFAQYWMREDCAIYNYYCDWADLDFNGSVDIDDLIILMSYWLQSGIYE